MNLLPVEQHVTSSTGSGFFTQHFAHGILSLPLTAVGPLLSLVSECHCTNTLQLFYADGMMNCAHSGASTVLLLGARPHGSQCTHRGIWAWPGPRSGIAGSQHTFGNYCPITLSSDYINSHYHIRAPVTPKSHRYLVFFFPAILARIGIWHYLTGALICTS